MATIPAVHQYWSLIWFVLCSDPLEVVEDGSSILWHTMIRPGGEVILNHFTRDSSLSSMLHTLITIYIVYAEDSTIVFELNIDSNTCVALH